MFDFFGINKKFACIKKQLYDISSGINLVKKELKTIMSKQDDIVALAAQENKDLASIAQDLTDIDTAITGVSKAIADAVAANPAVDLSALTAAQADLDAKTAALGGVAAKITGATASTPSPTPGPTEPSTPPV